MLSPDHQAIYDHLLLADVWPKLPGLSHSKAPEIDRDTAFRLIGLASALALEAGAQERTMAYEIVTRIAMMQQVRSPRALMAIDHILARLGNFPGRTLLRRRFHHALSSGIQLPSMFGLEAATREAENTIDDQAGGKVALTDFQFDVTQAFRENDAVSVSAPTSAGKSFVLAMDVVRRLKQHKPSSIVVVVPTRALIRQTMLSLREALAKADMRAVPLRCIPLAVIPEEALDGVVYVLTQERLLSLLHSSETPAWITCLIVDEAQGVSDGSRGVLLHNAIDATLEMFPSIELIFASPLAKNPEFFLQAFGRPKGKRIIEQHSPVSQNIILVRPRLRQAQEIVCELLIGDRRLPLGQRDVPFKFSGRPIFARRADFARAVTGESGCCVIYANRAADTESIATELCRSLPKLSALDPRIEEFIEFLEDHVHPEYRLISVLRHGVGFHFGDMPTSVRTGVEDLFRDSKLRYLCCTSTLLQGVNLPARDIVIENPKKGSGRPMARADFQNLAGRAGRLLREFHGNVWCLLPDIWEEKSFVGEALQEIRSALDETLADGGTSVRKLLADEASGRELDDTAAATLSRLYSDIVGKGTDFENSRHTTPENLDSIRETIKAVRELEITLPPEILERNASILPTRLEALFQIILSEGSLEELLPPKPFETSGYERLAAIFKLLRTELHGDTSRLYRLHAYLALCWIRNYPLKKIIDDSIDYQQKKGKPVDVEKLISGLIEMLERGIRYEAVKYCKAYTDILAHALTLRQEERLIPQIVPLHLYMECGASDPIVISLISLGLSRIAALLVKRHVRLDADATPESCRRILLRKRLDLLGLPSFCVRELKAIIG